ncbi:serine hydrolase domain-containing protein [Aquimarina sp. M1]
MKIKNRHSVTFITLLLIFYSVSLRSQQQQIQKIDSLFNSWNVPHHPGGSVMVVKNGKTIFSKAYGLASIEYNIPNATKTLFNIGSISKQFTAMGIVLLAQKNKLSFEDDIRKYIPELSDFGDTITISDLLHHTSGLRDLHGLLGLAGWRRDDLETNADVYRVLKHQKDLNFKPREEFLYCNTGYILLAKIIEEVSNSSFKNWMEENIFEPLGLKNTYVEDQYDRVVMNNSTSYDGNNPFKRAIEYWGYFGSGNIHSTTKDINLWLQNFINPAKNWDSAFNKLLSTKPLNNGHSTNYGFGVRIENHLERKVIQHGGAVGGFRAIARVYPKEQLQIVILSNFSKSNIGSKANKISEIIFGNKERSKKKNQKLHQPNDYIRLTNKELSKFEGIYWSAEEKYGRTVYVKNDTLRYKRLAGSEGSLMPINNNTFQLLNVNEYVLIRFEMNEVIPKIIVSIPNQISGILEFHQSSTLNNEVDITEYTGDYYSPELKTTYSISLKESDLYCEHIRHGKIKLKKLYNDIYSGDWPIHIIEIKRDDKEKVIGFKISNGRTRNVWFEKKT